MELILPLIAIIVIFIFVKYLLKKFLIFISVIIFSGVLTLIYKIPYSISIFSVSILLYSIHCIFLEFKYMGKSIIKPCRFYLNGAYEKLVSLLFSINYIVFMTICYILLMNKSFYMLDAIDLGISFSLTWICIWCVTRTRNIFLSYINTAKYEI